MALIELYRTTGDKQYLELAGYILQGDERADSRSAAPSTCSAAPRSPRAPSWKGMPCAPCMPAAAPPTTTWKPATQPIGRR